MATKWLGYSARGQGLVGGVEQLIAEKEALILETYGAIKIQSSTKITVKHKINIGRCPCMFLYTKYLSFFFKFTNSF